MPWRNWTLAEWNAALLRHFFFVRPDVDDEPIVQLVVTAEEFARAAGDDRCRAYEARDAFLSVIRAAVRSSGLLLGTAAREAARSWSENEGPDPPFVGHLLVTCLVASDVSDERAEEGNFRKRMDPLFGLEGSNHALHLLPPLWRRLTVWLGSASQRRRSRELILPNVGHYRIIGIPLRLSFPPRRDELHLVELLDEEGLIGEEPPIRAVLKCIEAHSSSFGDRFRRAFQDFRSQYNARSPSINRSPFWSAVRGAALAGDRREKDEAGSATLSMEADQDNDGHFHLAVLVDDRLASRLPPSLVAMDLPEPCAGYRHVLTTSAGSSQSPRSVDEPVRLLLAGRLSRGRAWRALTGAIREGVLLFTTDDDGATSLRLRLPEMGGFVDILVHDELAAPFVDALPAGTSYRGHVESKYAGWRELRAVDTADLALADFSSVGGLDSVRCLQRTLPPTMVRLRGGIRLDGGTWLGTPGFLPSANAPGAAVAITLQQVAAAGSPLVLRLDRSSPGKWSFGRLTVPLDGEFEIFVEGPTPVAPMPVTFRDTVRSAEYREPRPGQWITEGNMEESADVVGALVASRIGSIQSATPPWAMTDETDGMQRVERTRDNGADTEHLATALAAVSLRRSGIPEALLLDVFSRIFPTAGGFVWDILRAWVEVGAISRLASRSWRNVAYFAIRPHLVAYRTTNGVRATLMGLVAPAFRNDVVDAASVAGVSAELDWSAASAFTPPVLRLRSETKEALDQAASQAGLPEVAWLMAPDEALRPVSVVLGTPRVMAPKNYEVFGHWNWEMRRFRRGPGAAHATVSLEWMRRPDRPDYYLLRRYGEAVWWGRSRVWAIHAVAAACGRRIFNDHGDGVVDCPRPGEAYLPVSVARLAIALGAPAPGPILSGDAYRYSFNSASLRRVVMRLWPPRATSDAGFVSRMRWLDAAIRERQDDPAIAVPSVVRSVFLEVGGPEGARLAATPRIPLTLLPLILDLARRFRDTPLH